MWAPGTGDVRRGAVEQHIVQREEIQPRQTRWVQLLPGGPQLGRGHALSTSERWKGDDIRDVIV